MNLKILATLRGVLFWVPLFARPKEELAKRGETRQSNNTNLSTTLEMILIKKFDEIYIQVYIQMI